MSVIYLCIVFFLLFLALFDLFVGVSNDAVNILQSAVGAKVAKFRTVLVVASFGVLIGAVMPTGMMDVARHGIMMPTHFSFAEVMTIFLAVMVTDIIVLDIYNSLGMPTSTTYVTFMVAMGTSLADRAWSRESVVFRVTGVLSAIGGGFMTAAVPFAACAVVCLAMFYGGISMQLVFMAIVVIMLMPLYIY